MKVNPSLAALYVSIGLGHGADQESKVKGRDLHVKDTVSDDLGVDRDDVGSLGQSPNNGVSGPEAVNQRCVTKDHRRLTQGSLS